MMESKMPSLTSCSKIAVLPEPELPGNAVVADLFRQALVSKNKKILHVSDGFLDAQTKCTLIRGHIARIKLANLRFVLYECQFCTFITLSFSIVKEKGKKKGKQNIIRVDHLRT